MPRCATWATLSAVSGSRDKTSPPVSRAPDELLSFVCGIGDQALFLPQSDLSSLLALPPAIAPAIASARSATARATRVADA